MDPELARKNVRLGWLLFGVFCCSSPAASGSRSCTSSSSSGRDLAGAAGRGRRGRAGGGQGPAGHGGTDDDVRLGAVRRPRSGRQRGRGAAARGGRLRRRREDEPARVRVRDLVAEPALRHGAEPGGSGAARGRLERGLGCRHRRGRRRRSRSAPTPGARSGSPRRGAASSGSSRPTGSSRSRAASRSRRATTSSGRWRRRSRAASALMGALAPDFEPVELESLEELEVGVAWLDARGAARARSAWTRRRRSSRAGARARAPLAARTGPTSCARWRTSTAHSSAGTSELYGENVAARSSAACEVRDEEAAAAERERADYFERVAEAMAGVDLLVTPTVPFVAPPADVDELEIRRGRPRSRTRSARSAGRRSRFPAARQRTVFPPRSSSPPGRGRRPRPRRRPPARIASGGARPDPSFQ